MKTTQEILNFYGVEMGKKYKITKQNKNFANFWPESTFIVIEESNNLYITILDIYNVSYTRNIYILTDFDYEEIKSEILNEREKIYLKTIIEPFRDRIKYIKVVRKNNICGIDMPTLFFGLYNNDVAYLPEFSQYGWFENMENYRCYSLEELNL